jgi:hypothetical protein
MAALFCHGSHTQQAVAAMHHCTTPDSEKQYSNAQTPIAFPPSHCVVLPSLGNVARFDVVHNADFASCRHESSCTQRMMAMVVLCTKFAMHPFLHRRLVEQVVH